jgi:hypothetical protein
MSRVPIVCLLLLFLGGGALAEEPAPRAVKPRGTRILGLHVSEAADKDFGRAFAQARKTGFQALGLSVHWDDLEPQPGEYKDTWLAIANAFYAPNKIQVSLVIGTLDTARNRMPKDLQDKSFDDPVVVKRFRKLLDWVFTQIPDLQLTSVGIGNEVDGVLGTDKDKWAAYTRFFEAARTHIRKSHRKVPVGSVVMYGGHSGEAKAYARRLNKHADVVLVTYYPLDEKFQVRDPKHVHEVCDTLVKTYPNKPIHLAEIGCPSGTRVGSSEAKQAEFVREMFKAWDTHAKSIPLMSYCWLTDTSKASLEIYAKYYGSADPRFLDYLATLGLRTHEGHGVDKPAFVAFQEEARARGWGTPLPRRFWRR